MAEQSTGLTATTSTRSNVPYQLELFYNVTKRTETEVVMDIDVHVHYPNEWSSNGAWVMIDGARKNLNPNHTRGGWDWYASTQGTSRSVGKYWIKGKRFSADANATSISIDVGFSNYQWAAGIYHYQPITIAIPKHTKTTTTTAAATPTQDVVRGSSSVPHEPVSIIAPPYFAGDLPIKWSEAPQAGRYKIQTQKWGTAGAWEDGYSFSVLGSTHEHEVTLGLQKPGETYRVWVVPLYSNEDGTYTYTEGVHSKGPNAIVNTLPTTVTPVGSYATVAAMDDFTLNESSDPDGHTPCYELKIESIDSERVRPVSRQIGVSFRSPFREHNGERLKVSWRVSDFIETQTTWSGPITVNVGTSFATSRPISVNRSVFEHGLSITIPPIYADGRQLDDVREDITIAYSITKDGATSPVIRGSTSLYRHGRKKIGMTILYTELWDIAVSRHPELLTDNTLDNAKVEIDITQAIPIHTITNPTITLRNKVPKMTTIVQPTKEIRYAMDSPLPIIFEGLNIRLNGTDYNSSTKGTITIYMEDSATGEAIQLHRFDISGRTYDLNYYVDIEGAGCKPGNTYKLYAEIRLTRPTTSFKRVDLVLPDGAESFTTPQDIELTFETLSARTSFIENDLPNNEVIINYNLHWDNARAFQISRAVIRGTDENGLVQYEGEITTPITLFSKTSSEQNFRAGMLLGDIEIGDKWSIQSAAVMSQSATETDSHLGIIRENIFDFKLEIELYVQELYRTTSSAAEPDQNLLSDNVQKITQTYWCDTHELPYYMTTGVSFKRSQGI